MKIQRSKRIDLVFAEFQDFLRMDWIYEYDPSLNDSQKDSKTFHMNAEGSAIGNQN